MTDPLIQARLDKLKSLQERGVDPYPPRVPTTQPIAGIVERFADLKEEERSGEHVCVAGRLSASRRMGRATFLDLRDGTGKIQVYAAVGELSAASYEGLRETDIGDILAVSGEVFRTRTGELSIAAQDWVLLAKSLRPLPEKWHGLADVELRHRHRALDLIANESVRETFVQRSRLISVLRRSLDERGFIEVETPTMQPIAGGATARPFVTHHNALDVDLYLRIALELYLKRLLVGGLDRVYEIGKCFRNEGVSTEHNPEFTMLEIYQAYADYEDMMTLAEELVVESLRAVRGSLSVSYKENEIDFTPPWPRVRMLDVIRQKSGVDVSDFSAEAIRTRASDAGIELPNASAGKLIDLLFERFVEPTLIRPTFVVDYPASLSPLAKRTPEDERLVERFELFAGGMELANAFTELNDPIDQRGRFEAQEQLRAAGDVEAQRIDEEFLFAMEHGMPPAGGMGIGVDRVAMLYTGADSIRDVILFPTLRKRDS